MVEQSKIQNEQSDASIEIEQHDDVHVDAPRRICSVLVDRANYGRLRPVLAAIQDHPKLTLQVVCGGTMVLRRFDRTVDLVRADGFDVAGEAYIELEGSTPSTMAKSIGLAIMEFSHEFRRLEPDLVLLIGDRYEALGAAIAAAYMNIPICHVQGGEVSGSIDESARHAITKFSQFHVPATERAALFLTRMGEAEDTILTVGCPSSDIAKQIDLKTLPASVHQRGSGIALHDDDDFLLAVFHPTTTEHGQEEQAMLNFLNGISQAGLPTLLLWPNIDAGSDMLSKTIRIFRSQQQTSWLRVITNLTPDDYLTVLGKATVAVGNSSSFVRDAGYFGTPVVLVGNRQQGREHDKHVAKVPIESGEIAKAILSQRIHGHYEPSKLYGDGDVGPRVAQALADASLYVQKSLVYPELCGASPNAKQSAGTKAVA